MLSKDGNVAESYRYSAFGEEEIYDKDNQCQESSKIKNPWRFSSKRIDDESGLVYYGRRYYDPMLGKWLTYDPLGLKAGPNLYAFVLNDPLTHIDLYGLEGEDTTRSNSVFDNVRNWVSSTWDSIVGNSQSSEHTTNPINTATDTLNGWFESAENIGSSCRQPTANAWRSVKNYCLDAASVQGIAALGSATYNLWSDNKTFCFRFGGHCVDYITNKCTSNLGTQFGSDLDNIQKFGESTAESVITNICSIDSSDSLYQSIKSRTENVLSVINFCKIGKQIYSGGFTRLHIGGGGHKSVLKPIQISDLARPEIKCAFGLLKGTTFHNRIYRQMILNPATALPEFHGFPLMVENYAHLATIQKGIGRDGFPRQILLLKGSYEGRDGYSGCKSSIYVPRCNT